MKIKPPSQRVIEALLYIGLGIFAAVVFNALLSGLFLSLSLIP